jgi:pimeloyl-ACP methyl ester carboxylesterase
MELLLLPGLLCDDAVWADAAARLAGVARCRVAEYGLASNLTEMAERALAGAPASFAVAGHSLGARVALEVLRQAPGRVTRLALLDTGYEAATADEPARRYALLDVARRAGMRAMARQWVQPMVHPARLSDAVLIDAIIDMVSRRTPEHFAAQIEALLARPDVESLLRSVSIPTLVACGRDDAWSPLGQHEAIASFVPGSRLVAFDDCGHMAPMEQPGAVAAAMAEWLAPRVERPPRELDAARATHRWRGDDAAQARE